MVRITYKRAWILLSRHSFAASSTVKVEMANFYLGAEEVQDLTQGKFTDEVDGSRPIAKYFAVNFKYLGSHVSSNLFCYIKQISETPTKKEMDNLFMACLIKNGMAFDKDDRVLLTMIDIMALASHNLRSLQHYEMILRMMSWNDDTKNTLDMVFVKSDHSTSTIITTNIREGRSNRRKVPRSKASSCDFQGLLYHELSYDNPRTVLVLISCIHFYYSSLWYELYTRYKIPEFQSDWITASKPVCEGARERYWVAVNRKAEVTQLANSSASISEPGASFTRWRVPAEESDQWECN